MTGDMFPPFLFSFYESLPRQGPGDDALTRSLLAGLSDLPEKPEIIDMGCGTGAQTLVLAQRGNVTAVDVHKPFLDILMENARAQNLESNITPHVSSMDALPPEIGQADLIWSEGAVYIIGFGRGLQLWRDLVKPGGYVVVSEATRLVENPPAEAAAFWNREYPEVKTVPENCTIITGAGYRVIRTVELPRSAWTEFYAPQKTKVASLRVEERSAEEEEILGMIEEEIRIQEQYPGSFGYIFYVMQRPA